MQHLDWQAVTTCGVGLAALVYVARRWWPGLKGLFHKTHGQTETGSACAAHATGIAGDQASDSPSCGNGCGGCGHGTTPVKDHRVRIVPRAH